MDRVIDVRNLKFSYGELNVLDDVTFHVNKGDYLGIIGPNGSAKSTLIKLMLGVLKPLEGEIKLLGEKIEKFDQWGKVGYIPQRAANFNNSFPATVEEIVGANLYSRIKKMKISKKAYKEEIDKALEIVGMQHYKKRLIGNLSGGQQQRVFIAKVLVSQPELIFLDEPMSGMDAASEEAVYCLLAKLNKEMKISVVMVTHDIGAITSHANKLAIMSNRKLVICNPDVDNVGDLLTNLYGHRVNINIIKYNCGNCSWRNGAK
ncbi:MAG TPA: metal ABC transporter ATP-binding protein [Clostridiaceae bacterium]|nr:metal ABC transporter ATP-binding protein [Clostridiaceae bacterium]